MVSTAYEKVLKIILLIPFYLLALTMIAPYYWMLIGAFKPVSELVQIPPGFFVENPTLNNFYNPLETTDPNYTEGLFQRFPNVPLRFGTFFLNSLIVSSTITILSLIIASATAFVLAKQNIPGGNYIFMLILASMMVPWQVTIIPNFLIVQNFGWLNSYSGFIMPALAKTFAVFFLRQYIQGIPDELLDAARIDGASEFRIWWQIILPLITPALAAMTIFIILNEWNNFVWPLIIVQDDSMATLPLAMARLSSTLSGPMTMGVVMAGAMLASLPTLIVFLIFQRQFVQGIAMTGVKG